MNWSALPWNNIYLRVLKIQEQILQATRAYDKLLIQQLQKYLINSTEAYLISIESICQNINKIYLNARKTNNKQLIIQNKHKIIISKLILSNKVYKENNLYLILEKIKQYIIFLCLQPELEAKLGLQIYSKSILQAYYDLSILIFNCLSKYIKYSVLYWYKYYYYRYLPPYNIAVNRKNNLLIKYKYNSYTFNALFTLISILYQNRYTWHYFYDYSLKLVWQNINKMHLNALYYIKQYNIQNYYDVSYIFLQYTQSFNINTYFMSNMSKSYYKLIQKHCLCNIIKMYSYINKQRFCILKKQNRLFQQMIVNNVKNKFIHLAIYKMLYLQNYIQ